VEPVRVPLAQPLLLGPSLKGGQAFRWRALAGPHGAFAGVAEGRAWELRRDDDALVLRCEPALPASQAGAWARRYFRLGDDYDGVGRRLAPHAELGPAMQAWWGMRLLQTDPWECLLGFVTSIHDSVAAVETRMDRLCRHFGEPFRAPGWPRGWAHATPAPERVARAHEARLRAAAGMGFRARYLRGAARAVLRGDLPLREMARMPYADAHEVLLQVPGVGDKVADCVQLYGLGHLDSFPVDRWIRRAMERCYFAGRKARPRDIVALAQERWGSDAGYAQQFLFHHDRLAGQAARRRAEPAAR
jgi:N-glycosylase/DNA lyase